MININKYPKTKKYINLYFHVHQPYRLSNYSAFDIGTNKSYFDGPYDETNEKIIKRIIDIGYSKSNKMFLDLMKNTNLKISYSITGTVLEQLEKYGPRVIDQFREMIRLRKMELICETYYHSLSAFYSTHEFIRQIILHKEYIYTKFGVHPNVFRNTEFTYRNDIGEIVRELGFKAIYAEGWDPILDWRSPNYLYTGKYVDIDNNIKLLTNANNFQPAIKNIILLLKNYRRSDDIAFRFQLKGWSGYPLTADKFANWIDKEPGYLTNLCMDYETIGEHHKADSGIFEFYKALPDELAKRGIEFVLPTEALALHRPSDELDYPYIVSWADKERDLSAWTGNNMQKQSLKSIYKIETQIKEKLKKISAKKGKLLLDIWGRLQTSDHFYYMSTKYWSDGDVHKYFSPYKSPYEAYITFANVIRDFKIKYLDY